MPKPTPASRTEMLLARLCVSMKSEWADLVALVSFAGDKEQLTACAEFLAKDTGERSDSILRKIESVRYFIGLGITTEQITTWGQSKTLSSYFKARRSENYEKPVQLRFTVPGSLRELVMQDVDRIRSVLKLVDSEGLWDFLHSLIVNLTDEDLLHLAGELTKAPTHAQKQS